MPNLFSARTAATKNATPEVPLIPLEWVAVTGTPTVSGNVGGKRSIAITSDGTRLAVAPATTTKLAVYDTATWSVLSGTPTPPAFASAGIQFSPDGSLLCYVCDTYNRVYIYNTATWEEVLTGISLGGYVRGLAFSPDGSALAISAGSSSPYIHIYDTSTWAKRVLSNGLSAIGNIVFSPDGTKIASVSVTAFAGVLISDPVSGSFIYGLPTTDTPGDVAFNADGSILYVVTRNATSLLKAYDTTTWAELTDMPAIAGGGWGPCCTFVPTDNSLMIGVNASPYLFVMDCTTHTLKTVPASQTDITCCAASRNSNIVATNAGTNKLTVYR